MPNMSGEQTKNANPNVTPMSSTDAEDGKYQRSTIEFPYNDLDDSIEIARAIATNAGVSCTVEQLAAYQQKAIGGPFRVRLSSARMFGITKNEKGQVHLTELGRMITDPKTEAAARAEAFLSVELYKAIYEKYRKFALPGPTGLEKEIQVLGVSSKQADKARQTFMRSAKQAGFFAHGEDRLVKPAHGALPLTQPIIPADDNGKDGKGGGGGGGDGGSNDPLIRAMIQKLPPKGPWSARERKTWMKMMEMAFNLAYGEVVDDSDIERELHQR
jgi:hypothetical protein